MSHGALNTLGRNGGVFISLMESHWRILSTGEICTVSFVPEKEPSSRWGRIDSRGNGGSR